MPIAPAIRKCSYSLTIRRFGNDLLGTDAKHSEPIRNKLIVLGDQDTHLKFLIGA